MSKKIKDTKLGSWLAEKAPQVLGVVGDLLPDSGGLGIVKNLIDEGARLGVSSRGMGSLKPGKNGISEVQGDFYLATAADIVADPSAPDAFVAGIMEGKEWIWDNGLLKETQIQQYKDKIEKTSRKEREDVLVEAFKDFIVKL